MQYRNVELSKRNSNRSTESSFVARRGWETDIQAEKFAIYDPFNSPNILRCGNNPVEERPACQKALFEDDGEDDC